MKVWEPGQAGQTPPQSVISSSWFCIPSSQVSVDNEINVGSKKQTKQNYKFKFGLQF